MRRTIVACFSAVSTSALLGTAPAIAQQSAPVVRVDRIEVVQTIQDLDHTVPLIAEKPTYVRVFMSGDPVRGVIGNLAVKRSAPDPQFVAAAEKDMEITAYVPLRGRRENWYGSLNFLLPQPLTAEESLTLSLAGLMDSSGNALACYNCAIFSRTVRLEAPVEMRLRVIALKYQGGNSAETFEPRQIDLDMLQSWLKRAYPISKLSLSVVRTTVNLPSPPTTPNLFECENVNSQLNKMRKNDIRGVDQRTRYYGMVLTDNRPSSFFMRGCSSGIPEAPDASIVASGPTGPTWVEFPWDLDQSWGDWYGGHEIGHTLGRWHAGPFTGYRLDGASPPNHIPFGSCFEDMPDLEFPYPGGQISMDDGSSVGFDVGDFSVGLGPRVIPGKVGHDVMSYCEQQWISRYTYVAILDRLRAEDLLPAQPPPGAVAVALAAPVRVAEVAAPIGDAPPVPAGSGPRAQTAPSMGQPAPVYVDGDLISVVGTADLTSQRATIDYVSRVSRAEVRAARPDSQVRLRALDQGGAVIEDMPVVFLQNSHSPPGQVRGVVEAVLSARSNLKAIELLVGGKVAARYEAPAQINLAPTELKSAPLVQMPATAAVPHQLEWSAPTPNLDLSSSVRSTRYDIQASGDGGQTWQTLAVGVTDPNVQVDLSTFKSVPEVDVRVIANSGFESKVIAQRKVKP